MLSMVRRQEGTPWVTLAHALGGKFDVDDNYDADDHVDVDHNVDDHADDDHDDDYHDAVDHE